MDKIVGLMKEIMDFEPVEVAEIVGDSIPDMAPMIGSIITNFKIKRLSKRLDIIEPEIDRIKNVIFESENSNMVDHIKNFAFPILLQRLLDEDEEQKINYFINSIRKAIELQNTNESHLILIFDILDKLRCMEIDYLISLIDDSCSYEEKLSVNIIKYIESKLDGIGLVLMAENVRFEFSRDNKGLEAVSPSETKVTELGKEFVSFIR